MGLSPVLSGSPIDRMPVLLEPLSGDWSLRKPRLSLDPDNHAQPEIVMLIASPSPHGPGCMVGSLAPGMCVITT